MSWFDVTEQEAEYIRHGKPIELILNEKLNSLRSLRLGEKKNEKTAALFSEETIIAIIEKNEEKWKYGCVLG